MSRYFLMGPALPVTISQSKQAPVQALVGRAYLMVGVTLMTSLYDSTMHLHCLRKKIGCILYRYSNVYKYQYHTLWEACTSDFTALENIHSNIMNLAVFRQML